MFLYRTNVEESIFTNEETLLWTVIANYLKEVDVSRFNLNRKDWTAITYIYNSHYDPAICQMTPEQVAIRWKCIVKRYIFFSRIRKKIQLK